MWFMNIFDLLSIKPLKFKSAEYFNAVQQEMYCNCCVFLIVISHGKQFPFFNEGRVFKWTIHFLDLIYFKILEISKLPKV